MAFSLCDMEWKVQKISRTSHQCDWHDHDCAMLLLPREGAITVDIKGKTERTDIVNPGTAILIPQGVYHRSRASKGARLHTEVYIRSEMLCSHWIPPTGKVVPLPNSAQALLRYADSISDSEKENLVDRLLILEMLAIGDQRPLACAPGAALARAVGEKLSIDLDKPVNLDTLAAWAGVSRRHLTRLFRRFEGESIHQRITRLRIAEATRRIAAGESVLSASLSVGLSSPSHLSRLFKRHTGVNPSMARKRTS